MTAGGLTRAVLAAALTVGDGFGSVGGGGGLFPTTSAMGTMTMPTRTVSTKVTAPHSRTRKDRFTSREYYTRRASVLLAVSRLALPLALVQEPDEVLRTGQRLPPLGKEILRDDGLVRKVVDGNAPLVEGSCDLHLEVLLGGLITHDPVIVEASFSRHCHSCKSCRRGEHGLTRAKPDYTGRRRKSRPT